MKKILSLALLGLSISASAQHLPNGDFTNWKTVCGNSYQSSSTKLNGGTTPAGERQRPGTEPEDWNGSSVNQQVGMKAEATLVTQGSPDGNSWTVLTNKFVGARVGVINIGSNAPAFINFGTPWVYAVSKIEYCDGGVYGGMAFSSRPDAIKGRYKRTTGTEGEEDAHIIAYLWKGTFTSNIAATSTSGTVSKDDVDRVVMGKEKGTASGTLIASCDYSFSSTNNNWEEIIVPLNYVQGQEETLPEKMNVIISSADYWTRDKIKAGNVLEVDDVDFVYYHALSDLQVDGVTVKGFNENQTNYTLDVPYEAGKVTYTVKGRSAQAQETYDKKSGVLTIVVTNEGEKTTYTVQFAGTVTSYNNDLSVTINGKCSAPQPTEIQLIDGKDGSTSLALNNFILGSGKDVMPVGNIYLTNVQRSGENPMRLTTTQSIAITQGDLPGIEFWLGPELGKVPVELDATVADGKMTATIDIDMQDALGQFIHVVFAPTLNISTETNLNAEAGLYNLVVNRNFKKGWSTLCLPFGITPEQIGAEGAQAFTSESNNVLNFSKVEKVENMEANTPYIVYFSTEKSDPMYFGVKVENTEAKSVNNSGNFTFIGNYIAGMSMDGLYGVATINGEQKIVKGSATSTLPATCAYFTNSGTKAATFAINLEGEEITGINAINNGMAEDGAVYNLQGVKVSNSSMKNLPAGLYIMNGKKFIIK
ncbi:MAG: calycin-like domain-containing protein [Bacteroidales bacterium]|nr:calycin-like domain-containing protein [Bacteroidales bacterium]